MAQTLTDRLQDLSDHEQHLVSQGLLCPQCNGTNIKCVGENPDGIRMNYAYDCRECPTKWEGY